VDSCGKITSKKNESAIFTTIDLGNGINLELVYIPKGTFLMGSPLNEAKRYQNEGPQHQVQVPSFWMGKYPITQAQWQQIMGNNPSKFQGNNRPVERVSWDDCVKFCQKLSQKLAKKVKLPSEAEWEYACRAGTTTPFHYGATLTSDLANYAANYTYAYEAKGTYIKETMAVGQFPPNAFGLYDMHGQVWEWCADDWHEDYQGAPMDGSPWLSKNKIKVVRSGYYGSLPMSCRSASRNRDMQNYSSYYHGFRVVYS
jgi:formylglycine-generating enzyme required for sulfatase activity